MKTLNKDSQVFLYLAKTFQKLAMPNCQQLFVMISKKRMLMKDYTKIVSVAEKNEWESFKALSFIFFKKIVYKDIVYLKTMN